MELGENPLLPYIIGRDPSDESDLLFPKRNATKAVQVDGNNVELQLRVFSSGLCFLYRRVQFVLVNAIALSVTFACVTWVSTSVSLCWE